MTLISIRMLLESPNPKDPQDAEVAKMMMENPRAFYNRAHEWAVKYAGAPRRDDINYSELYDEKKTEVKSNDPSRYAMRSETGHCRL